MNCLHNEGMDDSDGVYKFCVLCGEGWPNQKFSGCYNKPQPVTYRQGHVYERSQYVKKILWVLQGGRLDEVPFNDEFKKEVSEVAPDWKKVLKVLKLWGFQHYKMDVPAYLGHPQHFSYQELSLIKDFSMCYETNSPPFLFSAVAVRKALDMDYEWLPLTMLPVTQKKHQKLFDEFVEKELSKQVSLLHL